jgi:adenylate cyclase
LGVPDVFLSYNREDQARARVFAEAFEAQGFSVWWDVGLKTGEAYDQVTENALRTAKAVVVLWSKRSVESRWVRAEATLADRNKTLVPCMIEPCERPIMFELVQTADLSHWRGETNDRAWLDFLADVSSFARGARAEPQRSISTTPATPALPAKPSIAVLPFANLSGQAEQDYFVDGMVVEIIAALSRIKSIFVIASGSTLSYKGKGLAPGEIARQLGVRYVLEGSVRQAGGRVRIIVQLIDTIDGGQIWTHRFEDTLDDVFALQDKVALSSAGVIEPAVQWADAHRIAQRPTDDMGSYDLYLRAMATGGTYEGANMHRVLELLDRAIALDPGFGAALALASRCHYVIALYGWSSDAAPHRRAAVEMIQRAVKAAGDDAFVLSIAAIIAAYLENDIARASGFAERAIAANPGSAFAWNASGAVLCRTDQLDLAVERLQASVRLDPTGPDRPSRLLFLSMALFQKRQFEESTALADELFQHFDNPTGCAIVAASRGQLGQLDRAREALARYRAASPRPVEDMARGIWLREDHIKLFLEGVALASGET